MYRALIKAYIEGVNLHIVDIMGVDYYFEIQMDSYAAWEFFKEQNLPEPWEMIEGYWVYKIDESQLAYLLLICPNNGEGKL